MTKQNFVVKVDGTPIRTIKATSPYWAVIDYAGITLGGKSVRMTNWDADFARGITTGYPIVITATRP